MALLLEKDGTETVGGISGIRDAFVAAGKGTIACHSATMRYGDANSQIIEFSGVHGGKPFKVNRHVPAGAPLAAHARALARELIEKESE